MSTIPNLANVRATRAEIYVDKSINSRQTVDDTEETKTKKLAEAIRVQGLIHPPLLMRIGQAGKDYSGQVGKFNYILIAGFRRQGALDVLGQQEGDYRLAPANWTLEDGMAANMVENLGREDLSTFDTAAMCARMAKDFKMGGADIAKKIKAYDPDPEGKQAMSEGHVNNLIRCVNKLHPSILKAWKDGHVKASMRTLIKMSADDQTTQVSFWKELTEGKKKTAGGDKKKGGGDKKRRPSEAQVVAMIEMVKASDKGEEWKLGAFQALKWANGADSIPGIKVEKKGGKKGEKKTGNGKKGKGGRKRAEANPGTGAADAGGEGGAEQN